MTPDELKALCKQNIKKWAALDRKDHPSFILARALLERLEKPCGEWQPIETATMDGSPVLVYPATWNDSTATIARWNKNEYAKKPRPFWDRVDSLGKISTSRDNPPTHWMPLPAAPKEKEGDIK